MTRIRLIVYCFATLLLAMFGSRTLAQKPPEPDNPSHRSIPGGLQDRHQTKLWEYATPELMELHQELQRLQRVREEDRTVRREKRRHDIEARRRAAGLPSRADQVTGPQTGPRTAPQYGYELGQVTDTFPQSPAGDAAHRLPPNWDMNVPEPAASPLGGEGWKEWMMGGGSQQAERPPDKYGGFAFPPGGGERSAGPAGQFRRQGLPISPDLKDWLADGAQEALRQQAADVAQEISGVTDQLNEGLGEELSFSADALSDLSLDDKSALQNMRGQLNELMRNMQARQKELVRQAQDAEKAWPLKNVPPIDWVKKVQPFINQEVIQQMRQVSEAAQEAVDAGRPIDSIYADVDLAMQRQRDRQTGLLGSVIKSIDASGADWLRSRKGKGSSVWKQLARRSKSELSKLNRSLATNSKTLSREARKFSLPDATGAGIGLSGESSSSLTAVGAWWGWALAAAAVLLCGGVLFAWRRANSMATSSAGHLEGSTPLSPQHALLRACDSWAIDVLGPESRSWHHRRVFAALQRQLPPGQRTASALRTLSSVYERVRYAPESTPVTKQQLQQARSVLARLQTADDQNGQAS